MWETQYACTNTSLLHVLTDYLQFYLSRTTCHCLYLQNFAQSCVLMRSLLFCLKIPITGVIVKWWPDLMTVFSPCSFIDGVVIEKYLIVSTSLLLHCQCAWTFSLIPSFIPGKAYPSWWRVIRAKNWRLFINGPKSFFELRFFILTCTIS